MTLREEITKSRNEMYDDVAKSSNQEDIELIIERIGEIEGRMDKIEHQMFNISVLTSQPGITKPSEPFPGYNDLIEEALPVIKAAIAKKKLELESKPQAYTED